MFNNIKGGTNPLDFKTGIDPTIRPRNRRNTMAEKATKTKVVVNKAYTNEELEKMGDKGKVLRVVKTAYSIAGKKENAFKGTKREKKKYPNGILYSKTARDEKGKQTGAYWGVSEDSEGFKKLYSAAKNAVPSVNKLNYDDSVKKLVDAFHDLPGAGGGGGRSLKADSIGFSL